MMPQQQEPMTAGLPDKTEYKKQQSSILATMVPQIMNAMGGGDPYVQKALQEQQQQYEQKILQNNLRGFMRTVSMPGTGQITPELIMEQAQLWDVPPDMAMQAITQFQQFRQISRGEKQKYSMPMPEGGVRSIEAYSDDPALQEGAWQRGEMSGMPGPPPVTESYNPDGTATIVPKVPGATINPKPDKPQALTPQQASFARLTPEQQEQYHMSGKGPGSEKTNAIDEKTARILQAYPNLGREDAQKIALGTVQIKTDPVAGTHTMVDLGTGEEKPLNRDALISQDNEQPTTGQDQTIFNLADSVAGPGPAAQAGASVVSGMVGGPVADEVIQARQYVTAAKNDFIRAMSINPRFPVGEIQRLEREVDLSPKVFSNPQVYQNKIIGINRYLTRRLQKELSVSTDQSMPVNDRKAARKAAADIGNFIDLLGVPPMIEKTMDREEKQRIWDGLESGQKIIVNGEIKVKP